MPTSKARCFKQALLPGKLSLSVVFEICYALDEGSISADETGYLGIWRPGQNLMKMVLNLFS